MKKNYVVIKMLIITLLLFSQQSYSQGVAINTDNSAPDPSAMLDVKSTSRGLLAPRMTLGQRNAIVNPATGLTIFQTDVLPGLYYNSGTPALPAWAMVGSNASQWLNNGSSIYYNLGRVGIGTTVPAADFHVAKGINTFTGSFGTPISTWPFSTNVSIGDNSNGPVLYIGQSTANKGYISWQYNPVPSDAYMSIGTYDGINNLTLQQIGGNVGVRTTTPAALFHVAEASPGYTGLFGTPISTWDLSTNVSIGDDDGEALMYIGQDGFNKGFVRWSYNAVGADAYFSLGSYSGSNPLILQEAGNNVGIGTFTPTSRLQVNYDLDGQAYLGYSAVYPNYFDHNEQDLNGDGQSAAYAFRTRPSASNGLGYAQYYSNSALKGYSFWGDLYSFGTSGFNYNDYTRCGGILGADVDGIYWGSLGYKNSGGSSYGGYFSSYTSGGGKSTQANTGIGLGAWGDLMGADIHGRVYGVYAEGENYATFSNGPVYKNNIDVHLQENGSETNTVLYTYVSTDVSVQTSGQATLSNGRASISFDAAFAASVSSETPVIVTVTPIGNSNGVYLAEVSRSGFTVVENNAGKSNVTVNFIAIGKRAGYEHPILAQEVIDAAYTRNMARGLHNDADTGTSGEGLYYENGKLVVGIHPSTLPDPDKPLVETVVPKPGTPASQSMVSGINRTAIGTPDNSEPKVYLPAKPVYFPALTSGEPEAQQGTKSGSQIENNIDSSLKNN